MTKKRINKLVGAPGGWRYFVPETLIWIEGTTWDQLLDHVRRHYADNRVELPENLLAQIEQQMCERVDCYDVVDGRVVPPVASGQITFAQIAQGTKTLGSWLIRGVPLVAQAEAERRATICCACRFNRPTIGCGGCNLKAFKSLIGSLTHGAQTSADDRLHGCAICTCTLRVKVHIPLDIIHQHTSAEQLDRYPGPDPQFPGCWIKPEMQL